MPQDQSIDLYSPHGYRLLSQLWVKSGWQRGIFYSLTWLGARMLQLPEDILVLQELLFRVRPDVVVETGTFEGGATLFYASMLELLGKGRVLSVDAVARPEARAAIASHAAGRRVQLLEGSSVDPAIAAQVRSDVTAADKVLVVLDSDHSRSHVRQEMDTYGPLVTPGSYLVVMDGVMEMLADAPNAQAGWATDNPLAAIREFLTEHPEFEVDPHHNRLEATYCPQGFLRRK